MNTKNYFCSAFSVAVVLRIWFLIIHIYAPESCCSPFSMIFLRLIHSFAPNWKWMHKHYSILCRRAKDFWIDVKWVFWSCYKCANAWLYGTWTWCIDCIIVVLILLLEFFFFLVILSLFSSIIFWNFGVQWKLTL